LWHFIIPRDLTIAKPNDVFKPNDVLDEAAIAEKSPATD
jgi:hypothetical protein